MTAVTLPNTGLKAGWTAGESGWAADWNKNLRALDALVQARVLDKDLNTPPGSPASGALYIIGPVPTGAWAGVPGKLALYQAGDDAPDAWAIVTPKAGWSVYVADEDLRYTYDGAAWAPPAKTVHTQTIGDGSNTSITVTHDLGTRHVHVTVYRNGTPWDTVACDVARPSVDTVELSGFSATPTLDEFSVVISR